MNQIAEQILGAIDLLIDKKIKQLSFDKTEQVVVTKVIDVNRGIYEISYFGNKLEVYELQPSVYTYSQGDTVYILIPQNNLNLKKIILGKVGN